MRVNAAAGRRGVKGLRDEGVKIPRSRDAPRSCGTRLRVLSRAKDAKVGKEDWLLEIGERIAHAKNGKEMIFDY